MRGEDSATSRHGVKLRRGMAGMDAWEEGEGKEGVLACQLLTQADIQMTFGRPSDITENVRLFIEHIRDASVKLSTSESALARVSRSMCCSYPYSVRKLTRSREAYPRPHRDDAGTEHRDQGPHLGFSDTHFSALCIQVTATVVVTGADTV